MTHDGPGMQVVLPGVMRYSELVAGAHLSGPAEVPQREIPLDPIRAAAKIQFSREISYLTTSAQLSALAACAPAIQPGRRSRPASSSISAARIPLPSQGNPMTVITEEATEEQQRVSAETRPVSDAKVPSAAGQHRGGRSVAPVSGIVDLTDGRGYLRTAGYRRSATDLPLTAGQVRTYGLRKGDQIEGTRRRATPAGRQSGSGNGGGSRSGQRTREAGLADVTAVNGLPLDQARAVVTSTTSPRSTPTSGFASKTATPPPRRGSSTSSPPSARDSAASSSPRPRRARPRC